MAISFNKMLDIPAAVDELGGQPIEQLRMRRRGPLRAKILGRLHDSLAEHQHPQPIDEHPGHQRIIAIDEPLGQIQAIRPAVCRPPAAARRSERRASRYRPSRHANCRAARIRTVRGATAVGDQRAWERIDQLGFLPFQFGQLDSRGCAIPARSSGSGPTSVCRCAATALGGLDSQDLGDVSAASLA